MMDGFANRLREPPTDSDEEDAMTQKMVEEKEARIAADETGGKGVNFREFNLVLDACARAGRLDEFLVRASIDVVHYRA